MDNNIKENLTNTLVSIKDYFINWHNTNYEILHQRTSTDIDNRISQLTANDIKTTTNAAASNSVQQALNNLNKNLTDGLKTKAANTYASNEKVTYKFDTGADGRGASLYGQNPTGGLMSWQDKVRLDALGTWYQIADNNKNSKDYLTIWFNPILRLCQMSYHHENCTRLKNQKKYEITNNSSLSWYRVRPLQYTSCMCAGTAGGTEPVFFYVRSSGNIGIVSTDYHSNIDLKANLLWFYRDGNITNDKIKR